MLHTEADTDTHAGIGHNRKKTKPVLGREDLGPNSEAGERLRSLVGRIERLEEERKVLAEDVKDIFLEAKSAGYDVKVLRQLIAIRKQDSDDVATRESILDLYKHAMGM